MNLFLTRYSKLMEYLIGRIKEKRIDDTREAELCEQNRTGISLEVEKRSKVSLALNENESIAWSEHG